MDYCNKALATSTDVLISLPSCFFVRSSHQINRTHVDLEVEQYRYTAESRESIEYPPSVINYRIQRKRLPYAKSALVKFALYWDGYLLE